MSAGEAICYSGAPSKSTRHRLGTPHYSYRFAEEKFLRCFAEMGVDTHFVAMPEFFSAPEAYVDLPRYGGHCVHVIFRSTEDIRILKSGYNIVCFAWEFPHLKTTTDHGEHPFLNQKRMLSLCDEIWVPCDFTKSVLEAHGLERVFTLPAAIDDRNGPSLGRSEILARLGHITVRPFAVNFLGDSPNGRGDRTMPLYAAFADAARTERRVFLSVFNPEDFRKNLDALVRGFDRHQQESGRDDLLLIKALTSSDRFDLEAVVRDVMLKKLDGGSAFDTDNILVFNDLLAPDEMAMLYDLADFYVCTSLAEGQNLPLQEAMARGVVPVTTRNTAMLDYVDPHNAIVIAAERRLNTCVHLAGNIAGKPYEVELCTARQVASALAAATSLDAPTRAAMSAAARAAIEARYSHAALRPLIEARLAAIAARPAGMP